MVSASGEKRNGAHGGKMNDATGVHVSSASDAQPANAPGVPAASASIVQPANTPGVPAANASIVQPANTPGVPAASASDAQPANAPGVPAASAAGPGPARATATHPTSASPASAQSSPNPRPSFAQSRPIQIAIDGPAGSGKSTIARALASRLGILYLDTGAMYRAFALKALRGGLDTLDPDALRALPASTELDVRAAEAGTQVLLDGEDVTGDIRSAQVGRAVSRVAAVAEIRAYMVSIQRRIARGVSVVMDGRDIGTAVLPDATFKFFLTADVETRARRRLAESLERGEDVTLESLIEDIQNRDRIDSTREASPLRKAADAVEIDTTRLSIDGVLEAILAILCPQTEAAT